jgi:hypothetical protein
MITLTPLNSEQLWNFMRIKPRGLQSALRDLGIRPIGGKVQAPVLWQALGLDPAQPPEVWADLTAPLMTAEEVGAYCGVTARTIYRWREGERPEGLPPMPRAIDLSNGREHARRLRCAGRRSAPGSAASPCPPTSARRRLSAR